MFVSVVVVVDTSKGTEEVAVALAVAIGKSGRRKGRKIVVEPTLIEVGAFHLYGIPKEIPVMGLIVTYLLITVTSISIGLDS